MTTTMEPTTTTTEAPAPAEPEVQTFTAGTLTIEAKDEAEALRKFQRLVRAEALKAQKDNDWCNSGTNDRLMRLGLRQIGTGIPMRVEVTGTRVAYIQIDADTPEEAQQLIAEGSEDVLAIATATVAGRGWKVSSVTPTAVEEVARVEIGDTDMTISGMQHQGVATGDLARCDRYSNGYYCTKEHGHVERGDMQHVAGNGLTVQYVWNGRRSNA